MKEQSSIDPSAVPEESDNDIASLLGKMQQQLVFLERKIDMLISQSKERPSGERTSPGRSFRKGSFSKPFRSFDHPQRHGQGEYGHGPRERGPAPGHFYDRRPGGKSRGPNPKKKSFSFKRKDEE